MSVHSEAPFEVGAPRRARILVVDDDPGIRALCVAVLEAAEFDVFEASDGREGLARAILHRPDLVVCDVAMPILDGFGFAVALRHIQQTRNMPLVFLTGESESAVEEHRYETGSVGFFAKPFEPLALTSFIQNVLSPLAPVAGGHAI